MDVGAELRHAREQRGLSLEQLSNVTKMSPPILRALESNDQQHLPGGLFTRSFVRSYAREVGLDPEEVLTRYLVQFAPDDEVLEETELDVATGDDHSQRRMVELEPSGHGLKHAVATVALVICALAFLGFLQWRTALQPPAAPPVNMVSNFEGAKTPETVAPASVGTGGTLAPILPIATQAPALKVTIEPRSICWVGATADGRSVVSRLMSPGDREAVEAGKDLTLRVGDPGAFAFSINGKPGRDLGPSGTPVTVQITPDNYLQFVSR